MLQVYYCRGGYHIVKSDGTTTDVGTSRCIQGSWTLPTCYAVNCATQKPERCQRDAAPSTTINGTAVTANPTTPQPTVATKDTGTTNEITAPSITTAPTITGQSRTAESTEETPNSRTPTEAKPSSVRTVETTSPQVSTSAQTSRSEVTMAKTVTTVTMASNGTTGECAARELPQVRYSVIQNAKETYRVGESAIFKCVSLNDEVRFDCELSASGGTGWKKNGHAVCTACIGDIESGLPSTAKPYPTKHENANCYKSHGEVRCKAGSSMTFVCGEDLRTAFAKECRFPRYAIHRERDEVFGDPCARKSCDLPSDSLSDVIAMFDPTGNRSGVAATIPDGWSAVYNCKRGYSQTQQVVTCRDGVLEPPFVQEKCKSCFNPPKSKAAELLPSSREQDGYTADGEARNYVCRASYGAYNVTCRQGRWILPHTIPCAQGPPLKMGCTLARPPNTTFGRILSDENNGTHMEPHANEVDLKHAEAVRVVCEPYNTSVVLQCVDGSIVGGDGNCPDGCNSPNLRYGVIEIVTTHLGEVNLTSDGNATSNVTLLPGESVGVRCQTGGHMLTRTCIGNGLYEEPLRECQQPEAYEKYTQQVPVKDLQDRFNHVELIDVFVGVLCTTSVLCALVMLCVNCADD